MAFDGLKQIIFRYLKKVTAPKTVYEIEERKSFLSKVYVIVGFIALVYTQCSSLYDPVQVKKVKGETENTTGKTTTYRINLFSKAASTDDKTSENPLMELKP